ncbi:MAG: hypothetical protein KDJ15_07915, partial [Alphaproteobacteria bacterium]|nr:hypothetical protein [Alphaproteobacteria bacterium]
FNVIVDAVADIPTISVPSALQIPSWTPGVAVNYALSAAVTDTDGSEEITHYMITGLPSGTVMNHGHSLGGGSWYLDPGDVAGLQLVFNVVPTQAFTITSYAYAEEVNLSGTEVDFTDNIAEVCPLVLDLNGDGVSLTNLNDGVRFDMTGDGVAEQTAWVSGGDGLLVWDRNGDGQINDISELFGSHDTDGFTILSAYDGNGDGVIDAQDDIWSGLMVWVDSSHDGVSQGGELESVMAHGIAAINLTTVQEQDHYLNGNLVSHTGSFSYEDGGAGTVVDAWFVNEHGAAAQSTTIDPADVLQGEDSLDGAIEDFVFANDNGDQNPPVAGGSPQDQPFEPGITDLAPDDWAALHVDVHAA